MSLNRYHAQRVADELEEPVREANELARKLGLEPYPVNYWIVDNDEMNELIAYDGFQERYPHWRWGMKYDRQRKTNQYVGGKAFELVNNDDPSNAFLQESNSLADQKAVITHVEAHADFFANNRWFGLFTGDEAARSPAAAALLSRHARTVESAMADPEIDRSEVERWIDNVLCVEDVIDQHRAFSRERVEESIDEDEDIEAALEGLGLSEEVRREVFDEAWLERHAGEGRSGSFPETPEPDLLAFLREHGKRYDGEADRAREMDPWQREILEMLRTESYYFAPQRMTKVMNEGWAAYWESMMMGEEGFAEADEFIDYADHQARVLGSPGLNPYKLGKELWEYVENTTNRREVIDKLLRTEGVTWRNFHDVVDFDRVQELLEARAPLAHIGSDRLNALSGLDDRLVDREAIERARDGEIDVDRYPWKVLTFEGLAERHYSLVKPQNRGYLRRIGQSNLERIGRYVLDDALYASVEEAIAAVDRTAGWDRMREIRESHNDVTFIDEFLTQEFVDRHEYFTYEYAYATGDYRATSTDAEDVKKKLLLQFTNFGKPTIEVHDGNYANRNELLLGHRYNGIALDVGQAKQTLVRVFELWGRPVNLMTIRKEVSEKAVEVARRRNREPEPEERGVMIRYDGSEFETTDLEPEQVEAIEASDIDYDTKPDEWLA
ncbi:SpoVR family protein [Halalkalicoccus ordinarius]|uniref:SpoVR family protein n=1 Tax=Halalkalicoccus ordinarius TaxID=3116651 RepID=UPI00300F0CF2